MFEFLFVYPLAVYGLYVLLGAPATDKITGLGLKAINALRDRLK